MHKTCVLGNWIELYGLLLHQSEFRDLKENLIFADVNKSLLELVTFMSMLGENTTILQLAVDSVYIRLCDSHNYLLNRKL